MEINPYTLIEFDSIEDMFMHFLNFQKVQAEFIPPGRRPYGIQLVELTARRGRRL